MRQISDGDKRIVSILELYGDVRLGADEDNSEWCFFGGTESANGSRWTHMGYGVREYNSSKELSSIDETFLALNSIMLETVQKIEEVKRA